MLDLAQKHSQDRLLVLTNATWEEYEALDSPEYSSYLISYLNREITIISPGRNHERISRLINILIADYCLKYEIPCFLFGSDRLKAEGREGKEPDEAFAFYTDKDMPDLAVEVNFTSGSLQDLTKYKYLKIKEVWIYQDRGIKFYQLQGDRYELIEQSNQLNKINSKIFTNLVNRGFSEDIVKIRKEFLSLF